jgi:phosphoglycolate phosphatase-like HAD superfamily hydrolase
MSEKLILSSPFEGYKTIFFDFDGVIKESVEIKNLAYLEVFSPFGSQITKDIRKHLADNGGVSRYIKIPLYLAWSGVEVNTVNVEHYIEKYSNLVIDSVIQSPWVIGVQNFLCKCNENIHLYIVSATPEDEINLIVSKIGISSYFRGVFGSPTEKKEIISKIIKSNHINTSDAVFVGDAQGDLEAAIYNNVTFVLFCNKFNIRLQKNFNGVKINNFLFDSQ